MCVAVEFLLPYIKQYSNDEIGCLSRNRRNIPIELTLINTIALLISGVTLTYAHVLSLMVIEIIPRNFDYSWISSIFKGLGTLSAAKCEMRNVKCY